MEKVMPMEAELSSDPLVKGATLLSGHAMLRVPDHLPGALSGRGEPVLMALPVLSWLLDLVRPQVVVNHTAGRGLAHLACCQMMVGQGGKCYLVTSNDVTETIADLRKSQFRGCSVDLRDPAILEAGSVELATFLMASAADGETFDWSGWLMRRAPRGVILAYGAGCHELAASGQLVVDEGAVLRLGSEDMPLLLALGPEAPAVLRALAVLSAEEAERRALEVLLQNQMRRLELEVLARSQPALAPDPTALHQPPPRSLAEAEAQIARLIEQQAADLDELQVEFDTRDAALDAQEARHQAEMEQHQAELARKEAIIARLENHIAAVTPASGVASRNRLRLW